MNPRRFSSTILSSAALLAVAFSAHANPRGVESKASDTDFGDLPVAIVIPSDLLSADTLNPESGPVIEIDEIAVFDLPVEPTESGDAAVANVDGSAPEAGERPQNDHESGRYTESAEATPKASNPEAEDDWRMPDTRPRIELDVPAPAITLDF